MDRILKDEVDRLRGKPKDHLQQIVAETRNPAVTVRRAAEFLLEELKQQEEQAKDEKAAIEARLLATDQETNTERRHREAQALQRWGLVIATLGVLAAWAAWWQAHREVLSAQVIRAEAQTSAQQAQLHSKAAADSQASIDRQISEYKSWLRNQPAPVIASPPSSLPPPQATPMPATPKP